MKVILSISIFISLILLGCGTNTKTIIGPVVRDTVFTSIDMTKMEVSFKFPIKLKYDDGQHYIRISRLRVVIDSIINTHYCTGCPNPTFVILDTIYNEGFLLNQVVKLSYPYLLPGAHHIKIYVYGDDFYKNKNGDIWFFNSHTGSFSNRQSVSCQLYSGEKTVRTNFKYEAGENILPPNEVNNNMKPEVNIKLTNQ